MLFPQVLGRGNKKSAVGEDVAGRGRGGEILSPSPRLQEKSGLSRACVESGARQWASTPTRWRAFVRASPCQVEVNVTSVRWHRSLLDGLARVSPSACTVAPALPSRRCRRPAARHLRRLGPPPWSSSVSFSSLFFDCVRVRRVRDRNRAGFLFFVPRRCCAV